MYSSLIGGAAPKLTPKQQLQAMKQAAVAGGVPGNGAKPGVKDNSRAHSSFDGFHYPNRLTYTLSALKIATGCGLVFLGTLALYQKASYARTASGLWAGIIVIISGVLGIFSVKMNASKPYVLSFFASCVIALLAVVLVIIYSATGLAKDSGFPGGFVLDDLTGELIPVSQVNIPARERAMMINLLLIVLGVLDVFFTLPCSIICLREMCECYERRDQYLLSDQQHHHHQYAQQQQQQQQHQGQHYNIYEGGPGGRGNDWLLSWLGQQNQIFYSSASGIPYTKVPSPYHPAAATMMSTRTTPPFVLLPSASEGGGSHPSHSPNGHQKQHQKQSPRDSHRSHRSHQQQRSKSPNPARSSGRSNIMPAVSPYTPLEVYPPHFFYAAAAAAPAAPPAASYPSPGSNMSHPSMAQLVPIHGQSPHHSHHNGHHIHQHHASHHQLRLPLTEPRPHTECVF